VQVLSQAMVNTGLLVLLCVCSAASCVTAFRPPSLLPQRHEKRALAQQPTCSLDRRSMLLGASFLASLPPAILLSAAEAKRTYPKDYPGVRFLSTALCLSLSLFHMGSLWMDDCVL